MSFILQLIEESFWRENLILHRNAMERYWLNYFRDMSEPEDLEQIRPLLPAAEFPIDWELTLLHRTVFKLNCLDLDKLLKSLSINDINSRDAHGRTALWWAANRGDLGALTLLIQHGADVNVGSNAGFTPLGTALLTSKSCARALLKAHADATLSNDRGWTALHLASFYGASISILDQILLQFGDINSLTVDGYTALMIAAQRGHGLFCERLISQGIDQNIVNIDGECALHLAMHNRHSNVLRLFLSHGTQHHLKTKAGETLLHYAAMYGDAECLEVLQLFALNGISPEETIVSYSPVHGSKDVVGRTAAQIAKLRSDVDVEWHEAFYQLVQAIKMANTGISRKIAEFQDSTINAPAENAFDVEEFDQFEDALEHQAEDMPPLMNQPKCDRSCSF